MSEPRAGEVVVEVAGAALGVDPQAEIAGTVVAVGDAAGDWLGRRVVVPRILPCGDCAACRRGRVSQCPSRASRQGLAARETVSSRWLTSVEPPLWPDGVELWQLAALADAALAPYTALSRAGVGPSDTVVIVGRDARARFAAAIAAAKGARVLVDDSCGSSGPSGSSTSTGSSAAPAAAVAPSGAIILACSGRDRARALTLLASGVTLAMLDGDDPLSTDQSITRDSAGAPSATAWSNLVNSEAQLLGVVGGHPDLLPELCALVVRGQLSLGDVVRRIRFEDAAAAHVAYVADGGLLPIAVPT